jgi:hypothetical protein
MKRTWMLLVGVVLLAGVAFAHGDEHVMGTVTKITETAITIEVAGKQPDAPKKSVTVNVAASTKFEKDGASATLKDLKVGDRVAIHAAKKGDQLEAHFVKIGINMSGMQHD